MSKDKIGISEDCGVKPTSICVLGMHRSGTSAVTRGLNIYGADLGHPLVGAGGGNPTGHWEHATVVDINERLLGMHNVQWWDTESFLASPPSWDDPELLTFRTEISTLLQRETKNQQWLWKDPRTCLTFPVWKDAFEHEGVDLACLIVIRNPLDVAKSLETRDGRPRDRGLVLWLLYTLSALKFSQQMRRTIVCYEDYLQSPEETLHFIADHLGITQKDADDTLTSELSKFLVPSLQHHSSNLNDLISQVSSTSVARVYELCLNAVKDQDLLSDATFCREIDLLYDDVKLFVSSSVSNRAATVSRLHWPTPGGYDTEHSQAVLKPLTGETQTYQFPISGFQTSGPLILVPVNFSTLIHIQEVVIRTVDGQFLHSSTHSNGYSGLGIGTNVLKIDRNTPGLLVLTLGEEPQLLLNIPDSVPSTNEFVVEFVMKVFSENSSFVLDTQRLALTYLASKAH